MKKPTEDVINIGSEFVRVITREYGAEDGMQLWEKIAEVINPSLKGSIFFNLITGNATSITIRKVTPFTHKVSVVKAIRSITNPPMTLRDAKDHADALMDHYKAITISIPPNTFHDAKRMLQDAGCIID